MDLASACLINLFLLLNTGAKQAKEMYNIIMNTDETIHIHYIA